MKEPETFGWDLPDGRSLTVIITDEGVIFDAYAVDEDNKDFHLSSMAMTAEEWFEFVESKKGREQ